MLTDGLDLARREQSMLPAIDRDGVLLKAPSIGKAQDTLTALWATQVQCRWHRDIFAVHRQLEHASSLHHCRSAPRASMIGQYDRRRSTRRLLRCLRHLQVLRGAQA